MKKSENEGLKLKVIARIHNDFPTKFGIPHQSSRLDSLKAEIVFEPEYRNAEAFRGLEEYTHIWLIWEFSEAVREKWSPTVRPPRLGGNIRKGVFATRSPYRPNALGLSSVKLDMVQFDPVRGPVLHVSGADLMDGTPVYDIKPYLAASDSHPGASGGFTSGIRDHKLQVVFPEEYLEQMPPEIRKAVVDVLADDPRPGYQKDPDRVYGLAYGGKNIRFRVAGDVLTVCGVADYKKEE